MKYLIKNIIFIIILTSCGNYENHFKLPILGRSKIIERIENGVKLYDTIPHQISDFSFINQDSTPVTNQTFKDKIYIADFFFTSCPTICPTMKAQMLRVYEAYKENPAVMFLSHTIDPLHDTVAVLKDYAGKLDVPSNKWHFVTGDQDEIYQLGEKSYMSVMAEDDNAPGGFIHSGALLLVDKKRHIRSFVDGTEPEQVDLLIKDIGRLLDEYEKE